MSIEDDINNLKNPPQEETFDSDIPEDLKQKSARLLEEQKARGYLIRKLDLDTKNIVIVGFVDGDRIEFRETQKKFTVGGKEVAQEQAQRIFDTFRKAIVDYETF